MIENNKIYYLIQSTFSLLAIFILLSDFMVVPVFDEFYSASVVGLIIYGFSLLVLMSVYRFPVISFPILFLLAFGLFHLSTMILTVVGGDYKAATTTYDFLDLPSLKVAAMVVMLSLVAFMLGVGTANQPSILRKVLKIKERRIFKDHNYTKAINWMAYGIYGFAIAIIMYLTLTGEGLSISMNEGYRAFITWKTGTGRVAITLFMASLNWLLPWSIFMILGCAENKRQLFKCVFFAGFGIILMVLAGDRTLPLSIIMLFFVRVYLLGINVNIRKLLPVLVLMIVLIPLLSIMRHEGYSSWNSQFLVDAVFLEAGDSFRVGMDPITATLTETGAGFENLMGTVWLVSQYEEYRYGTDYLKSLVVGIPFSGRFFDVSPPNNSQWIKSWLFPLRQAGPGFSISAESYLQLGMISVFVCFFILGYGLTYGWFYICANSDNQQIVMYLLIIMNVALVWVRNEFTVTVRPILWCWILIFILIPIIQKAVIESKSYRNQFFPHRGSKK